jgi:hypothetical protein
MKTEIDFPFHGYTKFDLMKFIYGEDVNKVDSAIPQEIADKLRNPANPNNTFWYVQDYNTNRVFGETVNLKEKFFDTVAKQAMQNL